MKLKRVIINRRPTASQPAAGLNRRTGAFRTLQESRNPGEYAIKHWHPGAAFGLRLGDLAMDSELKTKLSGIVRQLAEQEQQCLAEEIESPLA